MAASMFPPLWYRISPGWACSPPPACACAPQLYEPGPEEPRRECWQAPDADGYDQGVIRTTPSQGRAMLQWETSNVVTDAVLRTYICIRFNMYLDSTSCAGGPRRVSFAAQNEFLLHLSQPAMCARTLRIATWRLRGAASGERRRGGWSDAARGQLVGWSACLATEASC